MRERPVRRCSSGLSKTGGADAVPPQQRSGKARPQPQQRSGKARLKCSGARDLVITSLHTEDDTFALGCVFGSYQTLHRRTTPSFWEG